MNSSIIPVFVERTRPRKLQTSCYIDTSRPFSKLRVLQTQTNRRTKNKAHTPHSPDWIQDTQIGMTSQSEGWQNNAARSNTENWQR